MPWIDAEGNCSCTAWYGLGKGDQGHLAGALHSCFFLPFQNLLAKQGLRLLRGLRQGNVQEKVALSKKLLAKLRFLAQEVTPGHLFPYPAHPGGDGCTTLVDAQQCTTELYT